jgi:hypothetical protein
MFVITLRRTMLGVVASVSLCVTSVLAQQQQGAPPARAANLLRLDQYLDWEDVQDPPLAGSSTR